jgi:hypothetical protein
MPSACRPRHADLAEKVWQQTQFAVEIDVALTCMNTRLRR